MSRLVTFSSVLVAGLMTTMAPAPVSAYTYDKLTSMTFSRPVQIPGAMLDAGTYQFRLTNPDTSRNVLQVLSHDGSTVYAMFHTIPDIRMNATDEPMVTFKEMPVGVAPAVQSLFYGGELNGYEFVYPSGWPIMTAKVPPQQPITYALTPAAAVPEVIAEPEPAVIEAEPVAKPVEEALPQAAPAELPRTASPVPLVALGGLASLVMGLGVGLFRRLLG